MLGLAADIASPQLKMMPISIGEPKVGLARTNKWFAIFYPFFSVLVIC